MRRRRFVSVWLPNWPAQRLALDSAGTPPEPFVVAQSCGQKRLVQAVSAEAAARGLHSGITIALAQASVPGLSVIDTDPPADENGLRKLALWALRYTPLVAADDPDGILLDTGGADHLRGGERELLDDLLERFRKRGLVARAALSGSRLLSWGLARSNPDTERKGWIVPPGQEAEAAAALGVEALNLEAGTLRSLRRLGLERIGALQAAPRASLALRFGPDLLRRLDAVAAREPETFEPLVPDELTLSRITFAEPIGHTAGVEKALLHLTEELCADLARSERGGRIFDLHMHRVDGDVQVLRIRASAPSRDPAHLLRLFAEKLDRIDPGFGIERMSLAAPFAEPVQNRQRTTDEDEARDVSPLVDRIGTRIGEANVFRMEPTENDLPERSITPSVVGAPPPSVEWDRKQRPVLLIQPPQPVSVLALLPDNPPARFTWRGRQHRVRRADGPECIFGDWWKADDEVALTRDYYRVEDETGGRYWLFRARDTADGSTAWFVHGIFG